MIKIKESSSSDNVSRATQLLYDQGYTYQYIVNYVLDSITSDDDKYFGISLAYDSDLSSSYSEKEVKDFAKSFVDDNVAPKIVEAGSEYEYDYTELVDEVISDNEEEIQDFNNQFSDLEERQRQEWQDDIDYMNREYYNSVL